MAGDKEAKDFFLRLQPLILIPVRHMGQRIARMSHPVRTFPRRIIEDRAQAAKESMVPCRQIALRFLCTLHRFVDCNHQPCTLPECIERARLDQRLDDALI